MKKIPPKQPRPKQIEIRESEFVEEAAKTLKYGSTFVMSPQLSATINSRTKLSMVVASGPTSRGNACARPRSTQPRRYQKFQEYRDSFSRPTLQQTNSGRPPKPITKFVKPAPHQQVVLGLNPKFQSIKRQQQPNQMPVFYTQSYSKPDSNTIINAFLKTHAQKLEVQKQPQEQSAVSNRQKSADKLRAMLKVSTAKNQPKAEESQEIKESLQKSHKSSIKEEISEQSIAEQIQASEVIQQEISQNYDNQVFEELSGSKQKLSVSKEKEVAKPVARQIQPQPQHDTKLNKSLVARKKPKLQESYDFSGELKFQKKDLQRIQKQAQDIINGAKLYREQRRGRPLVSEQYLSKSNLGLHLNKLTKFSNDPSLKDGVLHQTLRQVTRLQEELLSKKTLQAFHTEFDKKMQMLLNKQQQVLRMEFEMRLRHKDEAMNKLMARFESLAAGGLRFGRGNESYSDRFQESVKKSVEQLSSHRRKEGDILAESDKLAESDDLAISWQSVDLWNNLDQNQKQEVYEKQSNEVVKFLSNLLLNEVKEDMFPQREGLQAQANLANQPAEPVKQPAAYQQKQPKQASALGPLPTLQKNAVKKEDQFVPAFDRSKLIEQLQQIDREKGGANSHQPALQTLPVLTKEKESKSFELEIKVEKKLVANPRLQQMKKVLDQAESKMARKNMANLVETIRKKIVANERGKDTLPKNAFIAQLLHEVKILDEKEVPKGQKQLYDVLQEVFLRQLVALIAEEKGNYRRIKEEIDMRADRMLAQGKELVLHEFAEVVPVDYYQGAIDWRVAVDKEEMIKYCSRNKVPKEELDQLEYFRFEDFRNSARAQGAVARGLQASLVDELARQFRKFRERRV